MIRITLLCKPKLIPLILSLMILLYNNNYYCQKKNEEQTKSISHTNIDNYSTQELIDLLREGNNLSDDELNLVSSDIIKRKPINELILAFEDKSDSTKHYNILQILYQIDHPLIEKEFRKFATDELSEEAYYCLNYLAKKGDYKALLMLNKHFYEYPVSSIQWATTIRLFGKYKVKEATRNLVNAINAASLNVADAAIQSLLEIYPELKPHLKNLKFNNYKDARIKITKFLKKIGAL